MRTASYLLMLSHFFLSSLGEGGAKSIVTEISTEVSGSDFL